MPVCSVLWVLMRAFLSANPPRRLGRAQLSALFRVVARSIDGDAAAVDGLWRTAGRRRGGGGDEGEGVEEPPLVAGPTPPPHHGGGGAAGVVAAALAAYPAPTGVPPLPGSGSVDTPTSERVRAESSPRARNPTRAASASPRACVGLRIDVKLASRNSRR